MGAEVAIDTLVDLLRYRAERQPDRLAFSFVLEEDREEPMTYAQLDQRARALAAKLQGEFAAGERVLLLYPPSLEYIVAFFGCLYAGLIPVPAYPPRQNGNLSRLQAVVSDAQAIAALTSGAVLSGIERRFGDSETLAALTWVATDEVDGGSAELWQPPFLTGDSLAFLQYTSGSTSLPKGVMLTHANLLHNVQLIERSNGTTSESRGVLWLPPYHDMGLIGGILHPLYTGYPMTLMAPVDFITRPLRWLEWITRTGATMSGGPNFAYELCLQKITQEQLETLDLSSWTLAFSGAEPIRAETLERFAEYFAPCGFRKEAFFPCYGLAEGTLFVSGGDHREEPIFRSFEGEALKQNRVEAAEVDAPQARRLVSSGRPALSDQDIAIVDPVSGLACAEGRVGEIWVSGPSVAQGYWNRPEQTRETFEARLAEMGEKRFLRTGDFGFLQEGELYVAGRLKDLIIIRGRNYYPQDLEYCVQTCHPAVNNGNGAAFTVDVDGEERLVVVQEVERKHRKGDHAAVVKAIREAISDQHQLPVHEVVLIKPASVPKTSSGKIQRHMCRELYVSAGLDVVYRSGRMVVSGDGATDGEEEMESKFVTLDELSDLSDEKRRAAMEAHLLAKVAEVLQRPVGSLSAEQPLHLLGLDSLMAVELKNDLAECFGVEVPFARLLEGDGLSELSAYVLEQMAGRELVGEKADKQANEQVNAKSNAKSNAQDAGLSGKDGLSVREFPLSYGQRALWFLQQLAPESAVYNIAKAVRVTGGLQPALLQKAFEKLAERHPLLRVAVVTRAGEPVQVLQEGMAPVLTVVDARRLSEAELKSRVAEEAYRPFALEQGPLMRAHVFERSEEESVLLLSFHHLVADFWSIGVLFEELWSLYEAQELGAAAASEGVFAGYVAAQERMLAGDRGRELLAYWREKLSGAPHVLDLPFDRPRPAVQTYNGSSVGFRLTAALSERLKKVAEEKGVTLYVLLMAAYQVLLHRVSGQGDILVGSPSAGRSAAEYARTVGYFVNPVVIRGRLEERPAFGAFLAQMRRTVLEALDHQELPFPLLVERLQPQRSPGYSPLVQVMFTWQRSHLQGADGLTGLAVGSEEVRLEAGGLTFEAFAVEQRMAQMDLWLTMGETEGVLAGTFEFNTDLFDAATIARMEGQFQTLLRGIVSNPECSVAELPLLTSEEREQVLVDWNRTEAFYEKEACLHHLFERQAERTPQGRALVFEDVSLTYEELNRRADRLARFLRKRGVGPEVRAAVCMERSPEMVVALLAVLKAGGCYVPLDPMYPAERLAFVLEDSQAAVLLTQERLAERWTGLETELVLVDAGAESLGVEEDPLSTEVAPEHAAYLIYTSGSTGKPKGVVVEHRNVVNFMAGMEERIGCGERDVCLAVTSISFDISVLELFYALASGAIVVLVAEPEQAAVQAEKHGATVMQATPSLMQVLGADPANWQALKSLRMLLLGGEALTEALAEQVRTRLPETRLVNMYGPTEATVWATTADVAGNGEPIVIGRPFANVKTYVLDDRLQPLPIGVPGELYIGGRGVARGYHNRPELTEAVFVRNPFVGGADERMYRTGDLAVYLPDGRLKLLGRRDQQVKIRGFRIEPGEIESALLRHASVRETVVADREEAPGEKYLACYVVPEGAMPAVSELRAFLQERVPEYMIPTAFVELQRLPLTPNGKVDRKALPDPQERGLQARSSFAAPQSEMEKKISAVWQEAFGADQVGVDDNFFEMGGHSLLAAQVRGLLKERLELEVSMVELFRYPTVRTLAKFLSEGTGSPSAKKQGRERGASRLEKMQQLRASRPRR